MEAGKEKECGELSWQMVQKRLPYWKRNRTATKNLI
jgi:hypothetical protein